ncbi:MAG: (d)CMP kinase [Longimonas sp.]|uniref:(d)CMP kinase n=1 Tax=Longimonas sp. TaxID=2039626 RepID=UPI00335EC9FF
MIVTIDGPAGAGKSSTAKEVAERLDFRYLDTGALYRAVALVFVEADASPTNKNADALLSDCSIDLRFSTSDTLRVLIGDRDVSDAIRTSRVGDMASQVAALSAVREALLPLQRDIAARWSRSRGGVVADGRDTGTVVFPAADLKIYMHASLEERARRRMQEYEEQQTSASFEDVREEIRARDEKDRTRDLAPLRRPDDAVVLDTTSLSFEEQVEAIEALIERAKAGTDVSASH